MWTKWWQNGLALASFGEFYHYIMVLCPIPLLALEAHFMFHGTHLSLSAIQPEARLGVPLCLLGLQARPEAVL